LTALDQVVTGAVTVELERITVHDMLIQHIPNS
jgi:hypothetical protein